MNCTYLKIKYIDGIEFCKGNNKSERINLRNLYDHIKKKGANCPLF